MVGDDIGRALATPPRILVVDDDLPVLRTLSALLRAHLDADVLCAESGEEGLEILGREEVDVIISDFRLGAMLGDDFLVRCCELAPHAARILITGQADVELAKRAINQARVAKMLLKPVRGEELAREVRHALDSSRRVRHHADAFGRAAASVDRMNDVPP